METVVTEPTYSSEGLLHHNGETVVLYFAGRPVGQLGDEGLRYLTTDHLGTPIALMSASMDWSGGFEPFGVDYSGASESGIFLRFPGQWIDGSWETSGEGAVALYNVHRWYSASEGAYLRPDPYVTDEAYSNMYFYASSSPSNYVDPYGLYVVYGPGKENIRKAMEDLKERILAPNQSKKACSSCHKLFDDLGLVPQMLEENALGGPKILTYFDRAPAHRAAYGSYNHRTDVIYIASPLARSRDPRSRRCLAAKLAHEIAHYLAGAMTEGPEGKGAEKACFGRVISGERECGF